MLGWWRRLSPDNRRLVLVLGAAVLFGVAVTLLGYCERQAGVGAMVVP